MQKSGIKFEVDQSNGAVMVPGSDLHTARMQLAKEGLPEGNAMGFEMLQKEQGFGTSQFIETARFQRALEGELSRTIATLRNVVSARVHLAIPKRSVFLRDRAEPTASVMVDLYSGRSLGDEQIAAIVHLVSSSVPHLMPENVTVVDQRGNLLSSGESNNGLGHTSGQFSYKSKLELNYSDRIRELLEPIVGAGRVRATVNADLDFTVTERTQETYNPDLPALRSEQVSEDRSSSAAGPSGVPGALSNQPPEAGVLRDPNAARAASDGAESALPRNTSKRSVRNYELDKTISHTKLATGNIRRLSIAVVIDNKQDLTDTGELVSKPWADDELTRFTTLVKEAVAFGFPMSLFEMSGVLFYTGDRFIINWLLNRTQLGYYTGPIDGRQNDEFRAAVAATSALCLLGAIRLFVSARAGGLLLAVMLLPAPLTLLGFYLSEARIHHLRLSSSM